MFRKTAIALAAFASLGTISLAPTAASAGYFHHYGYHHHYRHFDYTPRYESRTECVWVKKWTHYGPKFFKVCDYH